MSYPDSTAVPMTNPVFYGPLYANKPHCNCQPVYWPPTIDTWHAAAARALGCLPSQLVQCKQVDADGIERIWWEQKPE